MIESGFSGAMPYTNFYYFIFMLFLAPGEILIYAIFYKDFGYDYLYRIFGHYKYNFSFSLVETEYVAIDSICAIFDWAVIYLPFELFSFILPLNYKVIISFESPLPTLKLSQKAVKTGQYSLNENWLPVWQTCLFPVPVYQSIPYQSH